MTLLYCLIFTAGFAVLFLLPGIALARACIRRMTGLETLTAGMGMGLFVLPGVFYEACVLLRSAESRTLFLVLWAVVLGALRRPLRAFFQEIKGVSIAAALKQRWALAAVCAAVFFFRTVNFEGPANGYWDTYISTPAMMMCDAPVDFVDKNGTSLYEYALPGKLPENLVGHGTYEVITKDQRLGAAIAYAPAFLFFNLFGFRLFYALHGVALALCGWLLAERLDGRGWIGGLGALVYSMNPYVWAVNELNPNFSSLPLLALALYLLVREGPVPGFAVGLLFGFFGVMRMEGVIFGPAVLWGVLARDNRWRNLAGLVLGGMLMIWPLLQFNGFAFGDPFMHPTQFKGHTGFRPTFPHRFLGKEFEFNGMLNWPFHDEVVRTPHFPFPTFLLLPLTVLRTFGSLLSAAAILGFAVLWRNKRSWGVFCLLWLFFFGIVFLFQENWEELKTTFILLAFVPLCWQMTAWMAHMTEWDAFPRRLAVWILAAAALSLGARSLRGAEFKLDERWYRRFPLAKESISGVEHFGDSVRKHWNFYHTRESDWEYQDQKRKFTRGNLLPDLYYPLDPSVMSLSETWKEIRRETRQREFRTLDVWRYVYTDIEKTGHME